jgi:RNA recognition motif-containing protein
MPRSASYSDSGGSSRSKSRSGSRSRGKGGGEKEKEKDKGGGVEVSVAKLSGNVTGAHLEEVFGTFGSVVRVELSHEKPSLPHSGSATIVMQDKKQAERVVDKLDGGQLDGTTLSVSLPKGYSGYSAGSYYSKGGTRNKSRSRSRSRSKSRGSGSGSYSYSYGKS